MKARVTISGGNPARHIDVSMEEYKSFIQEQAALLGMIKPNPEPSIRADLKPGITESVGQRIKNRRIELGLSVDDIAKKLEKDRATIYRYENDEIENIPMQIIVPLSQVLDVSPSYLMGWEGFILKVDVRRNK